MHRGPADKDRSAGQFRGRAAKTHRLNVAQPMRGGIRL